MFLWGAGAKCVAFLQLLDPLRKYITKIIDINPKKQGMFIAGSGHEIVAPEYLKKINEKIYLIVMNENYLEEIKECVSRMGINQVSYMTLHE